MKLAQNSLHKVWSKIFFIKTSLLYQFHLDNLNSTTCRECITYFLPTQACIYKEHASIYADCLRGNKAPANKKMYSLSWKGYVLNKNHQHFWKKNVIQNV